MGVLKRVRLWLFAIRDSFITLLPVTLFGVGALLVKDFPLPAYQSIMREIWGSTWQAHLQVIVDATHGVFGVMLCALISFHVYARLRRDSQEEIPLYMVAISGLTNFMILALARGELAIYTLGHDSILHGIVVGIFSAEALRWATRVSWLNPLHMPYDTEAVFYHAIRLTTPFIAVGMVVAIAAFGFSQLPDIESKPWQGLLDLAQNYGGGDWLLTSIAVLINQVVWFVGTHGSHFLDTYAGWLFSPWGSAYDGALAWRPMFNAFVLLGGSGATFGLLIAIAMVVREGPAGKVAKLSVLPGIFNINETVLYGLPVVLNPNYLIPFVAAPLLLALLTLSAVSIGFLEFQPITIPWTTPPVISGWLLTDSWRGAVFQIIEIGICTFFYLPFVKKAEAARVSEQSRKLAETTSVILSEGRVKLPVTMQHDQTGLIARGLLSDLRRDMGNNSLKLAYQPKHALNGRVVGVEALLRWPHRRFSKLEPAVAITLAEDSGDIHMLGLWVLNQACACKARWNRAGFAHITVAVNVSPLQLTSRDFVQKLTNILRIHGLSPNEIELEITESLHIPDTLVVDRALHDLSDLGVRLAMDDFGMGYSSLLHLRRFRIHAIKIDGSLIRDVLNNSACADIVRTITELGRAQDIDVIAEYVETQEQRNLLGEFGCDGFQGELYSLALDEADCLDYFRIHAEAS